MVVVGSGLWRGGSSGSSVPLILHHLPYIVVGHPLEVGARFLPIRAEVQAVQIEMPVLQDGVAIHPITCAYGKDEAVLVLAVCPARVAYDLVDIRRYHLLSASRLHTWLSGGGEGYRWDVRYAQIVHRQRVWLRGCREWLALRIAGYGHGGVSTCRQETARTSSSNLPGVAKSDASSPCGSTGIISCKGAWSEC